MYRYVAGAIREGSVIKIRQNGERFWVRVKKISNRGLVGVCLNTLVMSNYSVGDSISFKLTDII